MGRMMAVAVVAVVLAGCLARVGGPEPGPEQFEFEVEPASGDQDPGEVVGDFASGDVSEASIVGTVATPLGEMTIVTYTETVDGSVLRCRATVGPSTGGAACTEADDSSADPTVVPTELRLTSMGTTNEWATVEVETGDQVAVVRGVAEDGTVYRSEVAAGYALLVYPVDRGDLELRGVDAAGAVVTPPVQTEDVGGPDVAPAPGT